MEQIVKSLKPMALAVAAAVVFVLGTAFLIASDATLTPSSLGASSDLAQPGRWLQFLAAAAVLAAVHRRLGPDPAQRVGRRPGDRRRGARHAVDHGRPARRRRVERVELLGPVTVAVGIGIWALLILPRGAHLAEVRRERSAPSPLQSQVWLATAVGLFVLAIGYGLTAAANSEGPAIAAGLLEAIGVGTLAGSVAAARSRGWLRGHPVSEVLAGLLLLAVSFLAAAIVAGLGLSSLTAQGVGLGIVAAIELAAFVVLGLAAWTRVRELYRGPGPLTVSLAISGVLLLAMAVTAGYAIVSLPRGARVPVNAGTPEHSVWLSKPPAWRCGWPSGSSRSRHRVADAQRRRGELGHVDAGDAAARGAVRRAGR